MRIADKEHSVFIKNKNTILNIKGIIRNCTGGFDFYFYALYTLTIFTLNYVAHQKSKGLAERQSPFKNLTFSCERRIADNTIPMIVRLICIKILYIYSFLAIGFPSGWLSSVPHTINYLGRMVKNRINSGFLHKSQPRISWDSWTLKRNLWDSWDSWCVFPWIPNKKQVGNYVKTAWTVAFCHKSQIKNCSRGLMGMMTANRCRRRRSDSGQELYFYPHQA